MKILAIDTSSNICSAAILEDTNIIAEKNIESGRSNDLMTIVKNLLDNNNLHLSDIDLFACSVGPGSFTGVRIGVSTIKAFVDATDSFCVPISSLEGLAYNVPNSYLKNESNLVCTLIDCRNENVYFGLFKRNGSEFLPITDFDAYPIDEALKVLKDNTTANDEVIFVGNGAVNFKYKILEKFKKSIFVMDSINNQTARSIGISAYYKFQNGESSQDSNILVPMYLRKSSAEQLLEEKEKNGKN